MTIEELKILVETLLARIEFLERENAKLRHRLSRYEHKKDSSNSSIPPSKDESHLSEFK